MNPDSQIILVSSSAHYPSHHWSNTVALMRALRRKGRRVRTVIFSTTTEPVPADLQGSVEPVFSSIPWPWRGITSGKRQNRRFSGLVTIFETAFCLRRAAKLARESKSPTLHFIGGSYWVVALAVRRFSDIRFVHSLYGNILSGPSSGWKGWLKPRLVRLLQKATATGRLDFTCETEFVRDEVVPFTGTHIHVVPYAIDDSETLPDRAEARRRLKLPPDEKIVLFFGTHRQGKDYHTALKGLRTLPEPPLALFVGKTISSNDPGQVVAACGYLKSRVVDEFVPEEQAKSYFAVADAVALPYEAGFSKGSGVLIECCRHLRPMIASATPYFSAFLTRYPCGVSYVPGDSASFAAAAGRLLSDSMSHRNALERARHDHSWTAAADQYIKLYDGPRLAEKDQPSIRPPSV
jgi:glycosyltransferase involved in cell wall biosynthesis